MYSGNFKSFQSKFSSKVNQINGYFPILKSEENDDCDLGSESDGEPMVNYCHLWSFYIFSYQENLPSLKFDVVARPTGFDRQPLAKHHHK